MRHPFRQVLLLLAPCAGLPAVCADARPQPRRAQREGHGRAAIAPAFAPDGTKIISGGQGGTLKLWDVATGGVIRSFPAPAQQAATPPSARTLRRQRRRAKTSARVAPAMTTTGRAAHDDRRRSERR